MNGLFENWVIFSDVDGTMLTIEDGMPQRNIDAIKYFTSNGGKFSIASGRGVMSVDTLPCVEYVNFPCALANGGVLYSAETKEWIATKTLDPVAKEITTYIRNTYPNIRIMAWDIKNRFEVGAHVNLPPDPIFSSIEELIVPWSKVVFWVNEKEMAELKSIIVEKSNGLVDITSSCEYFLEMVPKNVSKGEGIKQLSQIYNLDLKKIAIIGDYLNDLSMFQLEVVNKFCPSNSHPQIKALSHEIFCDVNDGAIADLIKHIEKGINRQ